MVGLSGTMEKEEGDEVGMHVASRDDDDDDTFVDDDTDDNELATKASSSSCRRSVG